MGLLNKKSNVNLNENVNEIPKNYMKDGWVRSDYILVSNKTNAKDLKPYQRLVVLRKPTGEERYIIDKSLPYSEIQKIQSLIARKKQVDINSSSIKRIIPNEFKTMEEIENESIENYENDLLVLKSLNSNEFNDHLVNNEITSLLKLEDDFSRISLNNTHFVGGVSDVDIIDSVRIYIPHEERKIKWNTFGEEDEVILHDNNNKENDDYNLENENVVYDAEMPLNNESYEIYDNQENVDTYVDSNEQLANDEAFIDRENSISENYETNFNQDEQIYLNNDEVQSDYDGSIEYEEQEKDYDGEILTTNTYVEKPKQTITSFFKNEIDVANYPIQNQEKRNNYYRFYSDSNTSELEKVVLNKKLNMFTMRKKIDKNLIEQKSKRY